MAIVGRPPAPPRGTVSQVADLAAWLKALLQESPRIRFEDVAVELSNHRKAKVHKSAISRGLDGTRMPPEDLRETIIEMRMRDDGHRAQRATLPRECYELWRAALTAETAANRSYVRLNRVPSRRPSSAVSLDGHALDAASESADGRGRSIPSQIHALDAARRRAEADVTALRSEIDALTQDFGNERTALTVEVSALKAEVEKLEAENSVRNLEIMALRVTAKADTAGSGLALADEARLEADRLAALKEAESQRTRASELRARAAQEAAAIKARAQDEAFSIERDALRTASDLHTKRQALNHEITVLVQKKAQLLEELEQFQAMLQQLRSSVYETRTYFDHVPYDEGYSPYPNPSESDPYSFEPYTPAEYEPSEYDAYPYESSPGISNGADYSVPTAHATRSEFSEADSPIFQSLMEERELLSEKSTPVMAPNSTQETFG